MIFCDNTNKATVNPPYKRPVSTPRPTLVAIFVPPPPWSPKSLGPSAIESTNTYGAIDVQHEARHPICLLGSWNMGKSKGTRSPQKRDPTSFTPQEIAKALRETNQFSYFIKKPPLGPMKVGNPQRFGWKLSCWKRHGSIEIPYLESQQVLASHLPQLGWDMTDCSQEGFPWEAEKR